MTELVLRYGTNITTNVSGSFKLISQRYKLEAPTREITILAAVLVLMQVLDGVLTACGIGIYGTIAEGNPLIRSLMEQWGYLNALVFVKSIAIVVIGLLCALSSQVSWLAHAFKVVIVVYMSAAVLPWSAILIDHLS